MYVCMYMHACMYSMYNASETKRVIVVYTYTCEADTLVFKFLYQRVMSLDRLSFVSARRCKEFKKYKPKDEIRNGQV